MNHDNNEVLNCKKHSRNFYDKAYYKFTFSNSINYKSSIHSHKWKQDESKILMGVIISSN